MLLDHLPAKSLLPAGKPTSAKASKNNTSGLNALEKPTIFAFSTYSAIGAAIIYRGLKAQEMANDLAENPERIDPLFEKWGLLRDGSEVEKIAREEWELKFSEDAYYVESDNYIFMATQQDAAVARQLSFYLERIYVYYEKSFDFDEKIAGRFVVRLHPNKQSFMKEGAPGFCLCLLSQL